MVGSQSRPRGASATALVAVLSDIHGNRQALDAVLRAVREAGVREWWCLGDLVGYGADPTHCLAVCTAGASRCLAGNHDLGASGRLPLDDFADHAGEALAWTRRVLGPVGMAKLDRLEPLDPDSGVPLYHASPRDPIWEYVLDAETAAASLEVLEAPLALNGHTHLPSAWQRADDGTLHGGIAAGEGLLRLDSGRWLVNPGSVGQPRDGDARAAWVLFDSDAREIRFRRTPYDVAGAQNAILSAGLPPLLAARLAEGW
jgi:diadenosine tetraphosphatase ApaH/serine/threonine PP2A family protein phosphatase